MNNIYEILEVCLQEVENGVDLETVLARYPEQAVELRPILQASINAKKMAVPEPSADVVRRNRAKLLQHAAQMREAQPTPTNRWFPSFQRLAVSLAFILLFLFSGTSLVRAASSALPGDSLYSVKRSWEDFALFFTFDAEAREVLEIEFENERLAEIANLFASGRPAKVDFSGIVTRQNGDGWWVANILVIVSEQTDLPDQPVDIGAAVRVTGMTNGNGVVYAEQIELLPVGSPLPEVEVEDAPDEIEVEEPQATPQPDNEDSTPVSIAETPEVEITMTPSPVSTPKSESFEGILNSIGKDVWTVNAIPVNITNAEIKGIPVIGARAKVEGYYLPDGIFIAIKIEIINTDSSNDNSDSNNNDDGDLNTNNNNDGDDNSNSNSNDDDDNINNDDNSNDDDNNNNG